MTPLSRNLISPDIFRLYLLGDPLKKRKFTHVKLIKGWRHNFKSSAIVNSDGFQGRSGYHPGEDDVSLDLLADTAKPWTS